MKKIILTMIFMLTISAMVMAGVPYVYNFPKPPADWGQAISFSNLSPGFFQVMFQNKSGVVRIATYGIVGASMDTLKDPQLMMVFSFDQKSGLGQKIEEGKIISDNN